MSSIEALSRILGIAFVSGINLYATVLAVGLGIRYHWVSGLPTELSILAHPAVLAVAAVMYLLEFFADKIPVVSSIWDGIHTFVRPVGGAFLALGAASGQSSPIQVLAFLVGGSVSLGTHSTKMGFRLLAHQYPEPAAHATVSVLEDVSVLGLLALAYSHPVIATCVLVGLIIAISFVTPLLFRTIAFLLRSAMGRVAFWRTAALDAPVWLPVLSPDTRIHLCFARSVKSVPMMKKGYLLCRGNENLFAYRNLLLRPRTISLGPVSGESCLRQGLIFDVLTIADAGGAKNIVYVTKDCAKRFQADEARLREFGEEADSQ